jgi:cation transport ATPase
MTLAAYDGLNLWRAAFIQVVSELSCILNAMRLLTAASPMTGEEAVKP